MSKKAVSIRCWFFTLNNPSEKELDDMSKHECEYLLYQMERGENGTLHAQGIVYYKNKRVMPKDFQPRAHWEVTRSVTDAIKYCCKEETRVSGPYEFGERPSQGKRGDLTKKCNQVLNMETTVDEIVIEDPMLFHQYGRTLERVEEIANRKKYRTEMTIGVWYHGDTGSGKSHRAFSHYSPDSHYVLNVHDKGWWEGYTGQKIVIINDLRNEISSGFMLQLVDKWPFSVPRRGKPPVPFVSEVVIVTSMLSPVLVYGESLDWVQIERRFVLFEVLSQKPEVVKGNTEP